MRIRPYEPRDRERLLELQHKHGDEYVFPDPADPLNAYVNLLEADDGALLGAVVGRVTLEGFLLLNRTTGTPSQRWGWARSLYEAGFRTAYNLGVGELHFWVPSRLRSYVRRLAEVAGLRREDRPSFTVRLKERYLA